MSQQRDGLIVTASVASGMQHTTLAEAVTWHGEHYVYLTSCRLVFRCVFQNLHWLVI